MKHRRRALARRLLITYDKGNALQLITYTDRLSGNLGGLRDILDNEFQGLFDGVHILPFFDPIDGADAGFDPVNHNRVDPRLGDWNDIGDLAASYSVMADLIVNHVSSDSSQFRDVIRHGESSRYWSLFLKKEDVYPDSGADLVDTEEVGRIYRPRPGQPFTRMALDDGSEFDFWTTFSAKQIDIDVEGMLGSDYLDSILKRFAESGVREIRLDAAGYAIKRRGTSCFMLPETFEFIATLSNKAACLGIETLVEIHAHYQTQIEIASRVGRVYDFALPPLVLHTLYTSDSTALKRWLGIAPRNCVTVLDTHDGIGILDVAGEGVHAGLLDNEAIDDLVETIHQKTGGASRRASGYAASNLDIYQVNSTFYDALGRDDRDYLIARAIQFFVPGTPQVYYTGLLAGENDLALVGQTGVGRDINRHHYNRDEIKAAMSRPVVGSLMDLIRLRNVMPAFDGDFSMPESERDVLKLRWDDGSAYAQLDVSLKNRSADIEFCADGRVRRYRLSDVLDEVL